MGYKFGFHSDPSGKTLKDRELEKRNVLQEYSRAGGERFATGEFTATVKKLEYNKVLLQNVLVRFKNEEGKIIEGEESHVWMNESKPFKDVGATEGCVVRFNAYTVRYKRSDGLTNYGLCRPKNVEIINVPR